MQSIRGEIRALRTVTSGPLALVWRTRSIGRCGSILIPGDPKKGNKSTPGIVMDRLIDWTMKENVRAKLRTLVKRLLRKYGYPPDKQEKATETVLAQAELLCKDWAT